MGELYYHTNRNTWLIFSHDATRNDDRRGSTWVSEQGMTYRMIILNKVSRMKGFDDVIPKSSSKYKFKRGLTGDQEIKLR